MKIAIATNNIVLETSDSTVKLKTSASLRSCSLVWERTIDKARLRSVSCFALYPSYKKNAGCNEILI